jgi:hypothetical protein
MRWRADPERRRKHAEEVIARLNRFFELTGAESSGCPVCGTEDWHISDEPDFEANLVLLTAPGGALTQPIAHMPVYVLVCSKCAFVRMHAKSYVEHTLAEARKR